MSSDLRGFVVDQFICYDWVLPLSGPATIKVLSIKKFLALGDIFTHLLVTEAVEQGGKKPLKGCKKCGGDGPECEVDDIRLKHKRCYSNVSLQCIYSTAMCPLSICLLQQYLPIYNKCQMLNIAAGPRQSICQIH